MKKYTYLISFTSFLLLSALTFTCFIIPENLSQPYILGLPRTLGAGILISFIMAFIVLLSAKFLPNETDEQDQETE